MPKVKGESEKETPVSLYASTIGMKLTEAGRFVEPFEAQKGIAYDTNGE
jgi:hypothetical protein